MDHQARRRRRISSSPSTPSSRRISSRKCIASPTTRPAASRGVASPRCRRVAGGSQQVPPPPQLDDALLEFVHPPRQPRRLRSLRVVQSHRVSTLSSANNARRRARSGARPSPTIPWHTCGSEGASATSSDTSATSSFEYRIAVIRLRVMRAPTASWWWKVVPLPSQVAPGPRLADVVEQRRQPRQAEVVRGRPLGRRGDVLHDRDRVRQHVLVPVDRVVFEPHRRQLGKELVGEPGLDEEPQPGRRMVDDDQLVELVADPLRRHDLQPRRHRRHRGRPVPRSARVRSRR